MPATISLSLWIGLIATPLLIALGQVLFKIASVNATDFSVKGIAVLLSDPVLIAALMLYGFGTLVWLHVLKAVPLGLAYSFMGLTFCFVPVLAYLFFGEVPSARQALGMLLVLIGLITINA